MKAMTNTYISSSPKLGEVAARPEGSVNTRRTHNQPDSNEFRRVLRTYGTSAEATLWKMLKARQVLGMKFRRQFSVGPYVLDFYCPEVRLCVELDGQPHFTPEGEEHDTARDEYLLTLHGIRTLRFENCGVFNNPEGILAEIEDAIRSYKKEQSSQSDRPLSRQADSSPNLGEQLRMHSSGEQLRMHNSGEQLRMLCAMVLCAFLFAFTSCTSEAESPFGGENGKAITATAQMPKNVATLTRNLPATATGDLATDLTLHYPHYKTGKLTTYSVDDAFIFDPETGDGQFSFTTASTTEEESLVWGQVAKDADGNTTFYLTANEEQQEDRQMWATATHAHSTDGIVFGQMKYRKAGFMLKIDPTHNLGDAPAFTASLAILPAADVADITVCDWPVDTDMESPAPEELTPKEVLYIAPQPVTAGKTILTIRETTSGKTWTLDLSTVTVKKTGGSTEKLTKFEAGTSLTLTVKLTLTELSTPGTIEITDYVAASTDDYTSALIGTTGAGYTIETLADGSKQYVVTNRYGLQAWLDAYAKDPNIHIVVDFPTENFTLTLPASFLTDTKYPVSGNSWAGKTWKGILFVDSEGNVTVDGATTDTDVLEAAILAVTQKGVPLVLTGNTLAFDGNQSYISRVSQSLVNSGKKFANSVDLILPDLTELPVKAFYYTTFLRSVSAPAVTTIGQEAFDGCENIETIDLPKTVTIGKEAFYGCWQITSLNLPEATTIGEYAFGSCTSLATVNLPKVTSIGTQAFYYCGSLTDMTFGSVVTSIGDTPFNNALTTGCTLTLHKDQPNVTAGQSQKWADKTWKEIKFAN